MKSTVFRNRLSIACCSAILLAGSSGAFSAPKYEHIAELHFSQQDAEVWWEPTRNLKYGFIEVSLSGPAGNVSAIFPYGEEPFFSSLEDGLYNYELSKAPPGTARSLDKNPDAAKNYGSVDRNGRSERQLADRAPGQENIRREFIQSGSFRIKNGDLVDPTIPEV